MKKITREEAEKIVENIIEEARISALESGFMQLGNINAFTIGALKGTITTLLSSKRGVEIVCDMHGTKKEGKK